MLRRAAFFRAGAKGHEIINHGTDNSDSVDYPDFAHPVAEDVENGEVNFGIIICGSGNGIAMSANKHQGIRAAVCWTKEISALARQHNNANIIAFGARIVGSEMAKAIVDAWLDAKYIGSGRHERRVNMIEEEAAKYNK